MQRTIGNELEKYGGVGPGFDVLRLGLACLIFYGHTRWIAAPSEAAAPLIDLGAAGDVLWHGWKRPRFVAMVPMFFALSGFLVTGSAIRTRSVRTFLTFRFLRIFPALATEVTLSAVILGPLLTTLPLKDYVSDHHFWEYFGNIVGRIRFALPGLFANNPLHGLVNINLWTLTPEFYCYLLVSAAMAVSLFYRRMAFTLIFGAVTVPLVVANVGFGAFITATVYPWQVMVYYFFAGCVIFHWRDRIPFGPYWFAASVAISYVLLLSPRAIFIAPLALTYATVSIGLVRFPKIPLLQHGDYSYGVYLYGFPIAQALVAIWPQFIGRGWWLLPAATFATFAFAIFSWHVIERPFLSLRRLFLAADRTRPARTLAPKDV